MNYEKEFWATPKEDRDYGLFLRAVAIDGELLEMAPANFLTPELCLAAVRQTPYANQYVPEAIKPLVLEGLLGDELPEEEHPIDWDALDVEEERQEFAPSAPRAENVYPTIRVDRELHRLLLTVQQYFPAANIRCGKVVSIKTCCWEQKVPATVECKEEMGQLAFYWK